MLLNRTDIEHSFITKCHNLKELFHNTNKLSTFISKLEKQSILNIKRYSQNDYLGDGFEFFVEIFLKTHSCDNRVGISNYKPIKKHEDTGVDGVGVNIKGQKSVVQIKFRSNSEKQLTNNDDHLSNMMTSGMIEHGVVAINDISIETPRHYIITTASGLHHYTQNTFFKNVVKCIGYSDLKHMLDENYSFWEQCRSLV